MVAGESVTSGGSDFAVVRYNVNGSLDTSFDGDGVVRTSINLFSDDVGRSVVIQSDGKIVVAGSTCPGEEDFALARYNADGSLDASFGTGGKVTTVFASSDERAFGTALQSDGKIVVVGCVVNVWDLMLMRYNTDGSVDTSFGVGGKVTTDVGSLQGYAYGVAIQSSGKIVVVGESEPNLILVRYNANGGLDTSFGVGGKVTTTIGTGSTGYGVAIQPDGQIVAVGTAYVSNLNWDFVVARYLGKESDPTRQVTLTVAPAAVAEDGSTNLVYTFTRGAANSSPVTVNFSVGGTATYGTDYTETGATSFAVDSGTVTIPANQTTATVTIDPMADTIVELDETVVLTVAGGPGYEIGSPSAATGTILNDDAWTNLASGRAGDASTNATQVTNATDGNLSTAWSSAPADYQWIRVFLGQQPATVVRVILRWGAAYGQEYAIVVSANGADSQTIYSTTAGDGGVDDITLAAPVQAMWVEMYGVHGATPNGFSLNEFEAYGVSGAPEITVQGNGISIADGDTTPGADDGTYFGAVAQGDPAVSHTFTVRNDGGSTLTLGTMAVPTGFTLTKSLTTALAPGRRIRSRSGWTQRRSGPRRGRSASGTMTAMRILSTLRS